MFKIEIDEDVYKYIESKAVPFIDKDPNSVLRKLLLPQKANVNNNEKPVVELQKIPNGIPDGLRQILQVIAFIKQGNNRVEATKKVALLHGIANSTVVDKYDRQLGKKALEVDELLREPGFLQFQTLLKQKFNGYSQKIDEFFNER
jgi:negative regulator of replication initiation